MRERLLQAANELFYAEGIHTVGIDRIIERAGVAKASLYATFGSKEELVRAYVTQRDLAVRERIVRKMAEAPDAYSKILAIFDSLADRIAAGGYNGCPFVRSSTEGPPGQTAAREAAAIHRAWRHDLLKTLALEVGVRDPEDITLQLTVIYEGASMTAAVDRDPQVAMAARETARRVLDAAIADASSGAKRTA